MPPATVPSTGPRPSFLDEARTVELCLSLADYGEAEALTRDLMLRVGQFATSTFPESVDVLLAAARMYRMGGALDHARSTLVGAGKLAPEETRTQTLLADVLSALGEGEPASKRAPSLDDAASAPPTTRAQAALRAPPNPRDLTRPRAPNPASREPRGEPGAEDLAAVAIPQVSPSMVTQPTMRATRARERSSSIPPPPEPVAKEPPARKEPAVPEPVVREANVREASVREAAVREEPPRKEPPRKEPTSRKKPLPPVRSERGPASGDPARARVNKLRLLAPNDPHRHLDPYELIGEIASGGMATVYLGRRAGPSGFERLVAVKRLHPHLAREEQFVEMFLDEARLAAGIHHPHVVPIDEVGESDQGYFLVMPFIEGETLSGLCARAYSRGVMLPRLVAVRIVLDALAGLHAAHQLKDREGRLVGLIHRDCTPQNILVGADGSSRITDFGVARAAARLAVTRPLTVKGKVAYLSPEQATAAQLDRRSDIFTMGIVLWEILAGRPLFTGDSDAAIVSRLLTQPIPSLRNFVKDIPPELDEVCGRALQRPPARRYATAAAMAEALERASFTSLGGLGSHADVGRVVEMLMGDELKSQRDALNAWIGQSSGGPLSRRRAPASPPTAADAATTDAAPASRAASPATPAAEASTDTPPPPATRPSAAIAPASDEPSGDASAAAAPDAAAEPAADASPAPPAAPAKRWTRRRLVLLVLALGILFVGGTSPLWFARANRLRHRLMGHPLPPTGTTRPRPSGVPRPRGSAPRPSASAPPSAPAPPPSAPPSPFDD
jgi:serine/threonine protein kinase